MNLSVDRAHLTAGLVYAALGMGLGIYMAASHNHVQHVTHAHLLLVGFLLSLVYAVIHRLWLSGPGRLLARLQFCLHHAGTVLLVTGLFLLYGGHAAPQRLEPMLAGSSILVLMALLVMFVMVLRHDRPADHVVNQPEPLRP